MRKLDLSKDLKLPLDAVTWRIAHLGTIGSGKTYGSMKFCELLLEIGAQVVVIDTVGPWHGLRLSSDGKKAGFSIPVFGGLHGDLPLLPESGAFIADLIVDKGISVILDVSQMIDAEINRFATAFGRQFFQRKKSSPSPVHVFLEECQEIIPQNPQKDENMKLHVFLRMIKIGRNFGIGISLNSQRPQDVNKKGLNLTEFLFVYQTTGKHERKAVIDWVREKGIDDDIYEEISKYEIGRPRVWSPRWLEESKIIKIAPKITFDSSATPKFGQKKIKPIQLTPIDLKEIETTMQAIVERARENDPHELKKQIAQLKRERDAAQKSVPARVETQTVIEKVPIITNGELQKLEKAFVDFHKVAEKYLTVGVELGNQFSDFGQTLSGAVSGLSALLQKAVAPEPLKRGLILPEPFLPEQIKLAKKSLANYVPTRKTIAESAENAESVARWKNVKLSKAERSILSVLAQYPQGRTKTQVAIMAHYAVTGGGFQNAIGAMKSAGYVSGDRESLKITESGLVALGDWTPLPTGQELLNHWLRELPKAERSILAVLAGNYPNATTKEGVAAAAGYEVTGGGFQNAIGKLRTLELIHGRNELKASDVFFE